MRVEATLVGVAMSLAAFAPALWAQTPSSTHAPVAAQQSAQNQIPGSSAGMAMAGVPQVTVQNGLLSIRAENSTIGDILRAVQSATGATVDFPDPASDRINVKLGPGRSGPILTSLLNDSRYDYILVGSEQQPHTIARIILITRRDPSEQKPMSYVVSTQQQPRDEPADVSQKSAPDIEQLREQRELQYQQQFRACIAQGCDAS